jgi:nicotinamide-nucleotide amidase
MPAPPIDSFSEALTVLVLDHARDSGLRIATAESCTGGLVAAALTAIPGSSDVVQAGVVAYANAAKMDLLGVPAALIEAHGAVSEPVAVAMAEGALERTGADLSVSVTGVAGPGGGSAEKPVGTVHFATALRGAPTRHRRASYGDIGRTEVRAASVQMALEMLLERLD